MLCSVLHKKRNILPHIISMCLSASGGLKAHSGAVKCEVCRETCSWIRLPIEQFLNNALPCACPPIQLCIDLSLLSLELKSFCRFKTLVANSMVEGGSIQKRHLLNLRLCLNVRFYRIVQYRSLVKWMCAVEVSEDYNEKVRGLKFEEVKYHTQI